MEHCTRPLLAGLAIQLCLSLPAAAAPTDFADYSQSCGPGAICKQGYECRGSCQPIHKPEAEKELGKRSVRVVLVNQTPFTLRRLQGAATHGKWSSMPPGYLNGYDYAQWQTDSNGLSTGTMAAVQFDIWGTDQAHGNKMVKVGNLNIKWNNPFDGSNDYAQSTTPGFAVDRVGGNGNHTTVFFFLRAGAQRDYKCADLWVSNHLALKPNATLQEFDEVIGFFTTAIKRTGVQGWTSTGCGADAEGLVVRDAQHSTDGFWTIDLWLSKFRVGTMDGMARVPRGQGRAIRIEVKPGRAAHAALNNDENARPRKGDRIRFNGPVLVDHGHFLEVHPDQPIEITSR
jgi:hypothetical protein